MIIVITHNEYASCLHNWNEYANSIVPIIAIANEYTDNNIKNIIIGVNANNAIGLSNLKTKIITPIATIIITYVTIPIEAQTKT